VQGRQLTLPRLQGTVSRLLKVLAQADAIDWEAGTGYYQRLNAVLLALADHYGYTVSSTVAAFVALSPNNDYHKNLRSLATLMYWHLRQRPVTEITTTAFNACRQRAYDFLGGVDFLGRTKGLKTRAFYRCILEPANRDCPIVVDGHMVNAWCGQVNNLKLVATMGFNYAEVERDVRSVADVLEYRMHSPQQIQAVIWLTWKRINRIYAPSTLDLFGDHWQIQRTVADLKPYPLQSIK